MSDRIWWRDGVLYQIYPRSFQDSTGDGTGDLEGIRSRLGHVASLGVDGIWLSPIYPSPMTDFGYDVADFCDVDPVFGTLADLDRMLVEAHSHGLRVILDLVPNHTSDAHRWFVESRSSRSSPKRDWYIWRDPKPDGSPPNNWLSAFSGPAWTLDEATGQYYLHSFLPTQPDLNWRNPEVADAMEGVMRFWLDRGVDGFRIDVVYRLVKDEQLRDNPWIEGADPAVLGQHAQQRAWNMNRPETHEVCRRFRRILDDYPGSMAVGEVTVLDPEVVASYYGSGADELHLAFFFHLAYRPWDRDDVASAVDALEAAMPAGGWPCWVLSNHDVHRHAKRFGPERARAAAVLLLTLRGTPFLYQGEEIGMTGCEIPPERIVDVAGRDPARTPMQWDDTANAGFAIPGADPWLPVCPDFVDENVAAQEADPSSILHLYRRLIALRRRVPALHRGTYERLPSDPGVLFYERRSGDSVAQVAVNFTAAPRRMESAGWRMALATHELTDATTLPPNAATILLPG